MKYKVITSKIELEGEERRSYGITSEQSTIEDISTEYEYVNQLVSMLNENQVSEIHFAEIIEDYIVAEHQIAVEE